MIMVHGDQDELLPVTSMTDAAQRLRDNVIEVETHVSPGRGHGIDEVGVQIGTDFLGQAQNKDDALTGFCRVLLNANEFVYID